MDDLEKIIAQDMPKKKGRPKGSKNAPKIGPPPTKPPKPKKPRPDCEKSELAKYPDPKTVVWGIHPVCPRFKRKGLAILYNPEHKGGMVTLMPVTDDGDGGLRWRYRWGGGPKPYCYDKIDLEPGQAASTPKILRDIADALEGVVKTYFGDVKGADKTTEEFHDKMKVDALGEKLKKLGNIF